jgi:nitroimidazol reductase NimA-like FMN-containing flavoprotein (pyridoxamine 5'-phosphate oxidase superfamily)
MSEVEGDPYRKHQLTTPSDNYSAGQVSYDKALVESILDDAFYCHIAYSDPEDKVVRAVPRQYGRSKTRNSPYVHGPGLLEIAPPVEPPVEPQLIHCSRLYRLVEKGKVKDVCVNVAVVDALVPARSAANAVLSYRSVVIYGKASVVLEKEPSREKSRALETIANHIMPGYANSSRPANTHELDHVGVIRIDFEHVSAKVRNNGPSMKDSDPRTYWEGVVPVRQVYGPPIRAPHVPDTVPVPDYVKQLTGSRGANNLVVTPKHPAPAGRPAGAPTF